MKDEPKYPVKTVEKALEILEYLGRDTGNRGIGITDMANDLSLQKSAVHRILDQLAYYGYVEQNPETSRYRLGWGLYTIGQKVPRQNRITNLDSAYLVELSNKTGETVNLGVRDRLDTILLYTIEGATSGLRVAIQAGEHEAIHATALGKILISEMNEHELRELFNGTKLHKYTNNTIETVDGLIEHLATVRANGFAVDAEEYGIGMTCIAKPVRDYTESIIAAVSVSVPTSRMTDDHKAFILTELTECTDRISWNLGYRY